MDSFGQRVSWYRAASHCVYCMQDILPARLSPPRSYCWGFHTLHCRKISAMDGILLFERVLFFPSRAACSPSKSVPCSVVVFFILIQRRAVCWRFIFISFFLSLAKALCMRRGSKREGPGRGRGSEQSDDKQHGKSRNTYLVSEYLPLENRITPCCV